MAPPLSDNGPRYSATHQLTMDAVQSRVHVGDGDNATTFSHHDKTVEKGQRVNPVEEIDEEGAVNIDDGMLVTESISKDDIVEQCKRRGSNRSTISVSESMAEGKLRETRAQMPVV